MGIIGILLCRVLIHSSIICSLLSGNVDNYYPNMYSPFISALISSNDLPLVSTWYIHNNIVEINVMPKYIK